MSILIKGALLDGAVTDVYIEKKEIRQVGADLQVQADQVIDGRRKALIPGFVNAHTHAAMTLFRGFGDDMPLMPWLEQKIWPNEAKLTREDVYWGTKLACLEMIKSGTTTFFDMYHKFRATADAVEEMGLRALLAGVCFDHFKPELAEKSKRENEKLVVDVENYSKRIRYAVGPHAIYTVSGELLQWTGTGVAHCPISNMKLASGIQFKFCEMRKAGVTVALGTDGCSSSNNLDMIEAMKLASLLGKAWRKDPEAIPASEIFQAATEAGALAIGLKAGRIAEGYLADLCLVDLDIPAFTPNHNFVSNLVYAANGSCIDTVICDGKILMQDKKVPGEEEIMEHTAELAYKLVREP